LIRDHWRKTERERRAIQGVPDGGFMVREVATLLQRPEGTIKADLFAARAKLKAAHDRPHEAVRRVRQ
jgi:DNA-directed RNA polymerase specialized sigma24 family protein